MPVEAGYERQVAPGNTAGLPFADANAFGAQIGGAIGQLGDTLHAVQLRKYQVERKQTQDRELSDGMARLARFQADAERHVVDLRTNAGPGAAGHVAAVEGLTGQAARDALLDGVTEDSVRQTLSRQFDGFAANQGSREYDWAAGVGAAKVATDTQQTIETLGNGARIATDPKALQNALAQAHTLVQGLNGVDDATRVKLSDHADQVIAGSYINGLIDRGSPQDAVRLIDSGAMNGMLSPAQIDQLRNEGRVAIDRQRVVAEQRDAQGRKALADQVATVKQLNDAGAVQDDKTLAALAAQLRANGDNSGAVALDLMRKTNGMAKVAKAMTAQQRERRIGQLAAIRNPNADQQIELEYYKRVKSSLDAQYNNDRGGWATANGDPPPPIEPGKPQSYGARLAWAQRTGAPFLQPNEAAALREQKDKGPAGLAAVADQLAAIPGQAAAEAARMVDGDDHVLARIVQLYPEARRLALNGPAARKANPQLIDGAAERAAREDYRAWIGGATRLLHPQDDNAFFDVGSNIFAAGAYRDHASAYDKGKFLWGVQRAIGVSRDAAGAQRGGVGRWRGQPVILMPTLSQAEFDKTLSTMAWHGNNPHRPVYRDGSPMTPTQLKALNPVLHPDGTYRFQTDQGQTILDASGGEFSLDIARFAKPARR